MPLHHDRGLVLRAGRGGLFDDDVVGRVLMDPQSPLPGKRRQMVADGRLVAGPPGDGADVLKEPEQRLRLETLDLVLHWKHSFILILMR